MLKNILLTATIIFISSCSTVSKKPEPPEISFAGASLIEMSIFSQSYGVTLNMQNLNDYDLPITGMTYKIHINDIQFASGVSDKAFTLNRLSSKQVNLTLQGNLLKIAPKLGLKVTDINKTNQQKFTYKITGKIYTTLQEAAIPYIEQGEISIAELMSK